MRRNILRISSAYFTGRPNRQNVIFGVQGREKVFCEFCVKVFKISVRGTPFNAIAQSTSKHLGRILHPAANDVTIFLF